MSAKNSTAAATATVTADVAKVMTDHVETAKRGTWEEAIKAVKAAMSADTRKLNALDKARAALLDTRVEVIRATAHAMTFKESHATAGKTAGKPSQSVIAEALGYNRLTFAPYFKAASELYAKFPELETEPGRAITDPEREHVASFWKAEALRAKARRDAAAANADKPKSGPVTTIPAEGGEDTDGASGGVGTNGTDGPTSVTIDTLMAALAIFSKQVETYTDSQGFTVEQGTQITEALDTAAALVHAATAK